MKKTDLKNRANYIVGELKNIYPDALCALEYENDPWKLLVMGRLSAQCTDARVNIVSKELFKKYKTVYEMANAKNDELEKCIFSCGLYKTKAQSIIDFSKIIVEKFDGKVPDNMDDLLSLPGVGRKIANLMLGDVFGKPAIVTDTHCIRISNRLGLVTSKDPHKVENELVKIIEPSEQSDFCHRLVMFGREYCKSQNPRCDECIFKELNCKK